MSYTKKESSKELEEPQENPFANIEAQNLAKNLSRKTAEISFLKKELTEKIQFITTLESEIFSLKKVYTDSSRVKRDLDIMTEKVEEQEKQIKSLNQKIIDQHKEFTEQRRLDEKKHYNEISRLNGLIDSYIQKTLKANMNELDNERLNMQLKELKKENENIIEKTKQELIQKEIQNKLKFTKLKNKMMENITETKNEVIELNMQYMDVSSKLTLLQNHQLLVQLDYQSQQLEEAMKKNEILEKKIFDLNKDLQVHKEVEISFAEKNKKLKEELIKYKKNENKTQEENGIVGNKSLSDINIQSNISQISNYSNNLRLNQSDYTRIINLEKKVMNLAKKLELKKKEYNDLKDKNEYIENILKNQDKKYNGLYQFLEECLNNFFVDENIINNKDIYINNESLKKFEFSNLTKEQKYSTLIILMKYLMPLIYSEKDSFKYNNSIMDKCQVKFHYPKDNKMSMNDKIKKFMNNKVMFKNISTDNIYEKGKKCFDNLPSIRSSAVLPKNKIIKPFSGNNNTSNMTSQN
jgi:hypothetical protein